MSENERFKKLIFYLVSNKKVRNQQQFAEEIGFDKSTVSQTKSGKVEISNNMFEKIRATYPYISIDWLKTGVGEMIADFSKNTPIIIDSEEDYRRLHDAGVPLLPEVDFRFSAGSLEIFNNKDFIKRYWYLPDCRDCDGVAQISGTSMMPTYPPGCWVALKRVGFDTNNPNTINFGNVFGIVIQDHITYDYHGHIKILRRHKDDSMSKLKWIARSINISEFDDFDILIEHVRGLWIVKQHVVSDVML